MHYLMRALTLDDEIFEFTIGDVPTGIKPGIFVCLRKPGTPLLKQDTIRRGDPDTHLFEGDLLDMDGERWVVSYERGFYVINEDYQIKYLYDLKDYKVVSNTYCEEPPVPVNYRNKHLFKYKDKIFRLNDIVGAAKNGNLILRAISRTVPAVCVKQECGIAYLGQRVYLGDRFEGKTVVLKYGRVCLRDGAKHIDIVTGGAIDGYFSKSTKR